MANAPEINPGYNMFKQNLNPVRLVCPYCRMVTVTRVQTRPGTVQWLLCLGFCLFGLWFCCCIPFCIDTLQDGTHSCANCGQVLGRIGQWEQ